MFSGIIEEAATVVSIEKKQDNMDITLTCSFVNELKIDQSVAHNGVCLTVVRLSDVAYTVTAIRETLLKSNLGLLRSGDKVNVERSMLLNDRLDGHMVQGHVDQTAECVAVETADGSWYYTFRYDSSKGNLTVEKGSICVNGVSLTVVNSQNGSFQVAIIPYTYENTNFHQIKAGTTVNLEFDIIGKYVTRILQAMKPHL
ncbi:MAG: riboflavin synthase [Bacteroidales bacterium]|jgi:riboflavin synthase|nr:riboflavin synthase [Bacteroidales bacterium]